jgi:pyrophosphatase PpaX
MQLKAFLFDLDGTLADTIPLSLIASRQALEPILGRHVSEEEVSSHFGVNETGILQRITPERWEEALQSYYRRYEENHTAFREPFADIITALDMLQARGIALGLVTGKGEYSATYTLKYLGLAKYFSVISTGAQDAIIKSRSITEILATWHIAPEYAAYIGDADTDMREAELAGVLPLAAEWSPSATIHRLAIRPAITFATVAEFVQWIDKNVPDTTNL